MSGPENNTSFPSEADKTIAEGVTWEMQDNMIMDAAEYHAAKITVVDAVKVAEEKVAKIIADAVNVAEEIAAKIIADAEEKAAEIIADAEEKAAKIITDAEEKAAEIIADAVGNVSGARKTFTDLFPRVSWLHDISPFVGRRSRQT